METLISDLETNNTIDCLNKEETSSLSDSNEDQNRNQINKSNNNKIDIKDEVLEKTIEEVKVNYQSSEQLNDIEMDENGIKTEEEIKTENEIKKEVFDKELKESTVEKNESSELESKQEIIEDKCVVNGSIDEKCVENSLIDEKIIIKEELSEKTITKQSKSDESVEEITSKTNCLINSSSDKVNESVVQKIVEKNQNDLNEGKNVLKINKSENKTEFSNTINETNNLFKKELIDCQLDCDVLDVIEELVNKVSIDITCNDVQLTHTSTDTCSTNRTQQTTGAFVSQKSLLSIEQTVSVLCDFLVDEICKQYDQNSDNSVKSGAQRGRGRPSIRSRGKGGRGRGRGRGALSVAKVNIYNISRGRRGSDSNDAFDDRQESSEREPSPVPQKRCSRRIQALQQKKMQQMSEQVQKEQTRIEEMAKKRCALMSAKDRSIFDEQSSSSSKKRSKKQMIEV